MDAIRGANIRMGVDPLGGAGVHYWAAIADRYRLNLTVVNDAVDATFRFMTVDWDGKIRMDPSSPHAMNGLIGLKDRFDIAFACDTDHDRHGIVTRSAGLLPPNHYLAVSIDYLFRNRPGWRADAGIGKTVVSSQMIDHVAAQARAQALRSAGRFQMVRGWTVRRIARIRRRRKRGRGVPAQGWRRVDHRQGWHRAGAAVGGDDGAHRARSGRSLSRAHARFRRALVRAHRRGRDAGAEEVAGESASPSRSSRRNWRADKIQSILTKAPGNDASIGGLKVVADGGWFAARPSGTEDVYKIYAESYRSADHLQQIQADAQKHRDGRALETKGLP